MWISAPPYQCPLYPTAIPLRLWHLPLSKNASTLLDRAIDGVRSYKSSCATFAATMMAFQFNMSVDVAVMFSLRAQSWLINTKIIIETANIACDNR